jgi:opacity protein-like surface antigen
MKTLLLLAFSLVLMAAPALAADAPIFPGTIKTTITTFVEGTDSPDTYKTIVTAGASGSKIIGIWVSSTDAVLGNETHVMYSNSTTDHCATDGTCATAEANGVEILAGQPDQEGSTSYLDDWSASPEDSDGNPFVLLQGGYTLEMTYTDAMTAGARLEVVVMYMDF